jgi:thioredoxin 1
MRKVLILVLLGVVSMAFMVKHTTKVTPDGGGIKFDSISLEKAKKEAGKKEKIIFIDAHTSWCGPCKQMAATSFKNEEVARLFNEKFINLKLDCEKDVDGIEISRVYRVRAYPTLLFINGEGKLIKQEVGFKTAEQLIAIANSL